jgi:hypothetical protein
MLRHSEPLRLLKIAQWRGPNQARPVCSAVRTIETVAEMCFGYDQPWPC